MKLNRFGTALSVVLLLSSLPGKANDGHAGVGAASVNVVVAST